MRFLTDYLENDKYFKLSENEKTNLNLIRAKNQFKLVTEIENNFDYLNELVEKVIKEVGK